MTTEKRTRNFEIIFDGRCCGIACHGLKNSFISSPHCSFYGNNKLLYDLTRFWRCEECLKDSDNKQPARSIS